MGLVVAAALSENPLSTCDAELVQVGAMVTLAAPASLIKSSWMFSSAVALVVRVLVVSWVSPAPTAKSVELASLLTINPATTKSPAALVTLMLADAPSVLLVVPPDVGVVWSTPEYIKQWIDDATPVPDGVAVTDLFVPAVGFFNPNHPAQTRFKLVFEVFVIAARASFAPAASHVTDVTVVADRPVPA